MKKLSIVIVCLLFAQQTYGLEQQLKNLRESLNKLAQDLGGGEETPPPTPVGEEPVGKGVPFTAQEEESFGPPPTPGGEEPYTSKLTAEEEEAYGLPPTPGGEEPVGKGVPFSAEEEAKFGPVPPPPSGNGKRPLPISPNQPNIKLPPPPQPHTGPNPNIPAVLPPPPPGLGKTTESVQPLAVEQKENQPPQGGLLGEIQKGVKLKKTASTQVAQSELERLRAYVAENVKNLPAKPKDPFAEATLNSWVDEELKEGKKQNKDWSPSQKEKELLDQYNIDVEAARTFL